MPNLKIVHDFFQAKGLSIVPICAIIGNLQQESSPTINPALHQSNGGPGRGIAQWEAPPHGARFTALEAFAAKEGTAWTDLNTQLKFMWSEMITRDQDDRMKGKASNWNDNGAFMNSLNKKEAKPLPGGFSDFIKMTDLEQAVRIFDAVYHRSGTPRMERRIEFAEAAMKRFNTAPVTPPVINPPKGDESVSEPIKEIGNGYKYEYQPAVNNQYWNLPNQKTTGIIIHSIGTPQPRAQVLVNNFNKPGTTASVHGFVEPGLYIETAPTRVGKQLAKKCYHVGGAWNNSRLGIEMCEPSTIKYTGGANFTDSNPENTKKYINDVTATMVLIAADLCLFHGIDVAMISTHAEAFRMGQGSNHGDPDHIWRYVGYSIAQFRKDVQARINELKGDYLSNMTKQEFEQILDAKFAEFEKKLAPVVYKFIEDVPEWGRPSVQKLLDNKIMSGTGTENGKAVLNISADFLRSIVIIDRTGIFDPKPEPKAVEKTVASAPPAETVAPAKDETPAKVDTTGTIPEVMKTTAAKNTGGKVDIPLSKD